MGGRGLHVAHVVVAASRKKHPISEDACVVLNEPGQPFFATVVDGHGWNERRIEIAGFAQFVANELAKQFAGKSEEVFPEIFAEVEKSVSRKFDNRTIVAVATCVSVVDGPMPKVTIAHAGDCRVYRFSAEASHGCEIHTRDHRVSDKKEEVRLTPFVQSGNFRIVDLGYGHISFGLEKLRLQHRDSPAHWSRESLAVTRGFGLCAFHPALTPQPDVTSFTLNPERTFLFALCSDGGRKIVQKVFEQLRKENDAVSHSLEALKEMAEMRLMQTHGTPKHDTTIIFFRVSPNLPTS